VVAVADHQPTTVAVELVGARVDVGGNLSAQRRGQHLPRPVAHDLIEQRRARQPAGLAELGLVLDYLQHGRTFPNQRANAGS
jgi:hypothetical protein